MRLLFDNRFEMDKPLLLEWARAEYRDSNRIFIVLSLCITVLYIGLAAVVFAMGQAVWTGMARVLLPLLVLVALIFLAIGLLGHRLGVAAMLRGKNALQLPADMRNLFFADAVMPASGENTPAASLADNLADIREAQARVEELKAAATLRGPDAPRLEELKQNLTTLNQQLDLLGGAAMLLGGAGRLEWRDLSGYVASRHLHILRFGDDSVLAARDGFTFGSNDAFESFVAAHLAAAARGAKDAKTRGALEKSLRRYFPDCTEATEAK